MPEKKGKYRVDDVEYLYFERYHQDAEGKEWEPIEWKVLEKNRMRREAYYIKKARYARGGGIHWEDELEYAILKDEWKEIHDK